MGVERPVRALIFWQDVLPCPEAFLLRVTVSRLKDLRSIKEREEVKEKEAKVGGRKSAEDQSQKEQQMLSGSFSFQSLKSYSCGRRGGWMAG